MLPYVSTYTSYKILAASVIYFSSSFNFTNIRQHLAYSTSKNIFLSHTSFRDYIYLTFNYRFSSGIVFKKSIHNYTISINAFLGYPLFFDNNISNSNNLSCSFMSHANYTIYFRILTEFIVSLFYLASFSFTRRSSILY